MKSNFLKAFASIIILGLFAFQGTAQTDSLDVDLSNPEKPDIMKWGEGEDSVSCVKNFSLYREDYKSYKRNKKSGDHESAGEYIESAVGPWRYVFNNCPMGSQNIYRDGAEIYKFLYEQADDNNKQAYGDTLMMIYDQRLEMYGWKESVGYILGRKAVAHLNFKKGYEKETFELFEQSFKYTEEGKHEAAVLFYHLYSAVNLFRTGKGEKEVIVRTYDKVSSVYLDMINNKKEGYKAFEKLYPRIERTFKPFATCKDLIAVFKPQFEERPEDVKLLKRISEMLDDHDCTESDLYFKATRRLHEVEPSAESAFLMGKMAIKRELLEEATGYLQEAADSFSDNEKKNQAYYMLASVYREQDKFRSARSSAQKALEYNKDDGRCYILIGDLYANSGSRCETDNAIESKSIYWAAADKYKKAQSVDEEVADLAREKLNRMKNYFPSQEDIFFENYNTGDTYQVECWINETTTVRHR
ncbi:MAG: hypothetical protein R6U19_09595 [Bacteroidales bacterium]